MRCTCALQVLPSVWTLAKVGLQVRGRNSVASVEGADDEVTIRVVLGTLDQVGLGEGR